MNYHALEDERLITLIGLGSREALEALYERYAASVFSLARYMLRDTALAEEVTQDVFLSVWGKANSYLPERGGLRTWIMSLAHHRAVDEVRRIRRNTRTVEQAGQEQAIIVNPVLTHEVERQVERNLDRQRVAEALKCLPPDQQQVILLAYFEGYTQSELAQRLGIPLGTVKTRTRLAMQKLRALLEGEEYRP